VKKTIIAAVAGVLLAAPLAVAAPASAGTPGCITKPEFQTIRKGWTQAHVHSYIGTVGKRSVISSSGGYVFEVRTYKVCASQFSIVSMGFDKEPGTPMRLSAKTGVWVN
jgi:hypothetical protein